MIYYLNCKAFKCHASLFTIIIYIILYIHNNKNTNEHYWETNSKVKHLQALIRMIFLNSCESLNHYYSDLKVIKVNCTLILYLGYI